ncbi:hypothetical protein LTR53_008617 [Teratosphaeriaceae sp. CCFEE 6253]|nr:hypothetical protein LTR53_008617 [Teratosphaeriaceae sp. CCFEE 6253]
MRSLLAAGLSLFASSALASVVDEPAERSLLEYNIETAYTRFTVPCGAACSDADDSLEFEVQIDPEDVPEAYLNITINGQRHSLTRGGVGLEGTSRISPYVLGELTAHDNRGTFHTVKYTVQADLAGNSAAEAIRRGLRFEGFSIDGVQPAEQVLFYLTRQTADPTHLESLTVMTRPGYSVDYRTYSQSFGAPPLSAVPVPEPPAMARPAKQVSFDISSELGSLHMLEEQAESLKEQIVAKKQTIMRHLKDHQNHSSLRQLLEECDGLVCAARVIAQRLCDKMQSPEYAMAHFSKLQNAVASSDTGLTPQQASCNCTKSKVFGNAQSASMPLFMTKNPTTSDYNLIDETQAPNPLVRAFAMIATVLGLAALCSYIRHRCMSMRTRVERAADREERRNARAYRKAARRAEMRRRWDNFVSAVNCFRSPSEPRMEDYEEKRALILQDAFMEQIDDLDQAEKGEIMEAEIRELRHAHEIVASLVRVDVRRYDVVVPANDPPPPLVPLPYTPIARSRASSYTLPSYTSESLPDYSSRPGTLGDGSTSDSLVNGSNGYTPSATDSQGRHTPPSTTSSARTRYTPTSSVLDVSPRASEETLRTRQSKDTR